MTEAAPVMPDRIVLDTNTVLALWMFRDPGLVALRAAVEGGGLVPLCRADSVEELRRVLAYRQFAQPEEVQQQLLGDYLARCRSVDPERVPPADLPRCRDPDDQKFLEIGLLGDARCLLTRDKALLRVGRHLRVRGRLCVETPESWQLRQISR